MHYKEKQLEKCIDTDFCHNQITYLVVWPYVIWLITFCLTFPVAILKQGVYFSIRLQEQSLRSHVALWRLSLYSIR